MPHFHIEFSGNLESAVNMDEFCEVIRKEAVSIETFPMPGIRVRAIRVDHYAIADGNPEHGFIDISVRLREGRTGDEKQNAIKQIFEAEKTYLTPVMKIRSIALSAELRDIDAALSPKYGTIRDHLGAGHDST